MSSRGLDEETSGARLDAMGALDEALNLFGDDALTSSWRKELGAIVGDGKVTPSIRASACAASMMCALGTENGGMRSKEEIRGLVEGFAKSGMRRREYCARHGIGMPTLDYWRHAYRKQKPTLVPIAIERA